MAGTRPDLVISCLSQKGGVGKSTLARLIARTYAAAKWRVKIADFNTKQTTSVDWVAKRLSSDCKPEIAAEPFERIDNALRSDCDLLVIDGKPDSDTSSLAIARASNLVVVPTGVTSDDLRPQVAFALELVARGITRSRILFVINRSNESQIALRDAQEYIAAGGFKTVPTDLPDKTGYQMAQNSGRATSETYFAKLNERAEQLAAEIVQTVNRLSREK